MGLTPSQFAKWYKQHEMKEASSSTIAEYTDYIITQQSINCESLPKTNRRRGLLRRLFIINKIWKKLCAYTKEN